MGSKSKNQKDLTETAESMKYEDFLGINCDDIATIVKKRGKPKCVALMADGTRRVLKFDIKHKNDTWLYNREHINKMIECVMIMVDFLFNSGIEVVIGPLISFNNILRPRYLSEGLPTILDALFESSSLEIIEKHRVAISFYGDLDYIRSLPGGEIVENYQQRFKIKSPLNPDHRILIGLGFNTSHETELITYLAIKFYSNFNRQPSHSELIQMYFGAEIPPIDIFIRTNEMRDSGGLTPLLTGMETQWYIPIAPGIMSFSETLIRRILYDYLYQRIISKGLHEHQPFANKDKKRIEKFYKDYQYEVFGLGHRVGDVWIPLTLNEQRNLRKIKRILYG